MFAAQPQACNDGMDGLNRANLEKIAMQDNIREWMKQIRELEARIESEIRRRGDELSYSLQNGKIIFEQKLKAQNRAVRKTLRASIRETRWPIILTAPVIYSLIVPLLLLDALVSLYQLVCFPLYRIPKVKRSDYLNFERMKLDYLNAIEKFNCGYCSYANGIIAYAREVASRTEQFWCPIKNAQKMRGMHRRYSLFTDYGDGKQYRENVAIIKQQFDNGDAPTNKLSEEKTD